jgi:hypothetical protein
VPLADNTAATVEATRAMIVERLLGLLKCEGQKRVPLVAQ